MTTLAMEPIDMAATPPPMNPGEVVRSTGPLVGRRGTDPWSQPPIVFYSIFVVEGRSFRGILQASASPFSDELGYSYQEMKAGEAEVLAGKGVPYADAMNALRSRICPESD